MDGGDHVEADGANLLVEEPTGARIGRPAEADEGVRHAAIVLALEKLVAAEHGGAAHVRPRPVGIGVEQPDHLVSAFGGREDLEHDLRVAPGADAEDRYALRRHETAS
jgi:hypothetical protein